MKVRTRVDGAVAEIERDDDARVAVWIRDFAFEVEVRVLAEPRCIAHGLDPLRIGDRIAAVGHLLLEPPDDAFAGKEAAVVTVIASWVGQLDDEMGIETALVQRTARPQREHLTIEQMLSPAVVAKSPDLEAYLADDSLGKLYTGRPACWVRLRWTDGAEIAMPLPPSDMANALTVPLHEIGVSVSADELLVAYTWARRALDMAPRGAVAAIRAAREGSH